VEMNKPVAHGRRIGFDFGEKRIGVATSDASSILVSPHATILNDDQLPLKLKDIFTEVQPIYVVIGNPIHLSGSESAKSISAMEFGIMIKSYFSGPVYMVDNTSAVDKVEILIEPGDSGSEIAQKLRIAGVIKAEKVFYKIAINDKRSKSITPGIHEIDLKISAISALEQLLDPKRNRGLFGFVEGLRKNEILDLLVKSNLVSGKYSGTTKIDQLYKTTNIEGFLFPAQYSIYPGSTFDQAVDQMIDRFYIAAKNTGIDKGFKNYSPYELLIIASMVQSEGDLTDFPKIARVIYNRLEIGMPLQINATIDYATNTRGKIRLPYKRLDTNSKYNTYKYRGLPPGPISNPGEKALEATVNPASGDWLYYVTVKPNDTRFTKSFDQFNIWANEFRKNEDAGLFN